MPQARALSGEWLRLLGRPPDTPEVDVQTFVIQCAISIPIIVGLVVYTLTRWDRTPLHLLLVALLASLVPWLGGQVVKLTATNPTWAGAGLNVEHLVVPFMSPLFLVTMGYFARFRALEIGRPFATVMLCLPFLLAAVYATDAQHGLYFTDRAAAVRGAHPESWGGPLYWAAQIWSGLLSFAAIVCLVVAVWRGRNPGERRRSLLVMGAVAAPVVAHFSYALGIMGLDFSLAPLALGGTAALFVYGVETHGVLEPQPIVRSDVLENLHDALVLADTGGVVLDANAAAEALLQADRKSLRGGSVADLLARIAPPDQARRLGAEIVALSPDQGDLHAEIQSPDDRSFELTSASVRAWGTQPAGVFLSLRDRSEHRRNEQLLRTRQKLESVGILAAGVAHEVNNPLAFVRANLTHLLGLSGEIQKIAESAPEDVSDEVQEMPEILTECLEGVERISRIVESMLRFSRAPEDEGRPVDLNEVVRESIRLAELHRDRSVSVESLLQPSVPPVHGSSDRLIQVVLNLFLNGKQALAGIPSARLFAETSSDGENIFLRVRDNGPGIPAEDLQRIFDPFFTTRGPDEGTGLGLSIAFDIVREHGGVLDVESRVGEGTCFTIRLPVAAREPEPA